MKPLISIAIDAMGGDLGPAPIVAAALRIISDFSDVHLTLVGNEIELAPLLQSVKLHNTKSDRIRIHHAADVVNMDDKPSLVLRQKQQSSMWRALELVREGEVAACVSGGNTGALMALGKFLIKTFPGIDRPAICKPVPSLRGHCYLLDLGANINCTAEQLVQFGFMGTVLAMASDNNPAPRVGLLNIGEENIKGIEQVRAASNMMREEAKLNYIGFVEGDDIYTGDVDVVVCDGFVGNIALKVTEGAASLLAGTVRQAFTKSWYARISGLIAKPVIRKWRDKYDPVRHNGASFLGLQGTLVKSHGGADELGFYHAVVMAIEHVRNRIPEKINAQFEELFI